jgi:hypothetical protein
MFFSKNFYLHITIIATTVSTMNLDTVYITNSPPLSQRAMPAPPHLSLGSATSSPSGNLKFGLDYRDSDKIVKCMSREVPPRTRFNRSGTIPFCVEDGIRYYCMGVDAQHEELTDFAGGVKVYEQWLEGGVRETSEESLSIFDFSGSANVNILRTSVLTIHDNSNTIILFPKVEADRQRIIDEYAAKVNEMKEDEIENSRIMWIPEAIFNYLIFSGKSVTSGGKVIFPKMYGRVRELLVKGNGAYNTLYLN